MFDLNSNFNIIYYNYVVKLGLIIQKTNAETQKFDKSILRIFEIVVVRFLLYVKLEKIWFFQKTFLFTDINIKIVLKILFFIFSKPNIWFT